MGRSSMSEGEQELTCDDLFDGALRIWQRRKGYRFGLDSLLLATGLDEVDEESTVVELGAGQGAVSLAIAHLYGPARVVAVERQSGLSALLKRNAAENEASSVTVVEGDLREHREILEPHSADLVVANPPFFRAGDRRPPEDSERAAARHELFGTVADFVVAAAYVLKQRGRLEMILPPLRLFDAVKAAEGTGDLVPESLRFVHSRKGEDAYLVVCRFRRGGAPDLRIRPPLYVYEGATTDYTEEVARRLLRRGR